MKHLVFTSLLLLTLLVATPALAAALQPGQGLVPCTGVTADASAWNCGVSDFFKLIQNILEFCIFYLAVPLATVAIAYAGINMATHPDDPGTITEGKKIIWSVVIGLAFVLGAFLLVRTLMDFLLNDAVRTKIGQFIKLN